MLSKILLAAVFLFSFEFRSVAQTTPPSGQAGWNPIGFNVSGTNNTVNGVTVYYQLSTCNGEDVVFVKFVNNNNYSVNVEWYPAVFTQEHKWIKKETLQDKKSVTLNQTSALEGDCSGTKPETVIRLSDFSIKKSDFFRYSTSNIAVSKQ